MSYKILLSAGLVLLSVSGLAEDHIADIQLAYSSNVSDSPYTNKNQAGGFYIDCDLMKSSDYGLMYGIGIDANTWSTPDVTGINKQGLVMYTAGGSAKIGYDMEKKMHIPVRIKVGYGYGAVSQNYHNNYGQQYEAGIEFKVFEGIAIGYKYKYAEAYMHFNKSESWNHINSNIAYLSFPF